MKLGLILLTAAVAGVGMGQIASANLLNNGAFATNASSYSTDPGYDGSGSNPARPTSWNISNGNNNGINGADVTWTPGNPHTVFGPANPAGVTDFLFLQSYPGAGTGYPFVGQSVAFAPNTTYTLTFSYAGRNGNDAGDLGVVVNDGSSTTTNIFDTRNTPSELSVSTGAWQSTTLMFTTSANAGTLGNGSVIFTNDTAAIYGDNNDVTVDVSNVVLTPEPGSLALLALGGLGLLARRRCGC